MVDTVGEAQPIAAETWRNWLDEIGTIGGGDALADFNFDEFGHLNLERAHPVGLAQFVVGRPTLLSNLLREPSVFPASLQVAKRIKAKSDMLLAHYGVDSLHMLGGLVRLGEPDNDQTSLPILLWPVRLIARGEDFELTLLPEPRVNPALVAQLAKRFGVNISGPELLRRQAASSDPVPQDLLNYLRTMLIGKPGIELLRSLTLGNFAPLISELIANSKPQDAPLLRELSGTQSGRAPATVLPQPQLVADADAVQARIVARILAGDSLAVETLPGTGYTQTVVNSLAALVQGGKRVLVVAPRKQTLAELTERFAALGLGGLAIRSSDAWLDTIAAISRNERYTKLTNTIDPESVMVEHAAATEAVASYFTALEAPLEPLGVSVAAALARLSELTALPHAPKTAARIAREHLPALRNPEAATQLLLQASELGEFDFDPEQRAWYDARITDEDTKARATALAKRLHEDSFTRLEAALSEYTASVQFAPANNVDDWGRYLRLFVGIRETLDRFQGAVFDRPLTDLIVATGPRKPVVSETLDATPAPKMSGLNRRRLAKLAREYLRPGMAVTDMHAALKEIAAQGELWQRYSQVPNPPQVPLGIQDAQVTYQSFMSDLEELERYLSADTRRVELHRLPLAELKQTLASLAQDTDILDNLLVRKPVTDQLRDLGLGDLLRDLAHRKVPAGSLAAELELAWWQSALEILVAKRPQLLGVSGAQLDAAEQRFAAADSALAGLAIERIGLELARTWNSALRAWPEQADALKAVLRTGRAEFAQLSAVANNLWRSVAPVVLVSPYEAASALDPTDGFDTVFVLDAAGTSLAENLVVLQRARQLVAWGDDVIAAPDGFETRCLPLAEEDARRASHNKESLYQVAKRVYGNETMARSWRTTGQTLGALINRDFYQQRMIFEPTAAEFFGEPTIHLDLIERDNRAEGELATESLPAEVRRVVELVIEHAKRHPEDSLLVASPSRRHAENIRVGVAAALGSSAELAAFFDGHGRERFEISSIADLKHRIADRVIFSVGFGLTAHGALLSRFGQLQSPAGRRYLANLLVSSRREIAVVSCFDSQAITAEQLAASRAEGNGVAILAEILTGRFAGVAAAASEPLADGSRTERHDAMLADLSVRLQKLGVRVSGQYTPRLPLVCSYAKSAAVIDADWRLTGANLRERLRLRPALLRALGWQHIRVHSFELFADPQSVAVRIAGLLGLSADRAAGEASAPAPEPDPRAFDDNDARLQADKPPHWG